MILRLLFLVFGWLLGGTALAQETSWRCLAQVGENLRHACISPDGQTIASLTLENGGWALRLWKPDQTHPVRGPLSLQHPPGSLPSLSWSPDNQSLAVANQDQVWLFQTGSESPLVLEATSQVRQVRCYPQFLLARCNQEVRIWNLPTGDLQFKIGEPHLLAAALDPEGQVLALAALDEPIWLYPLQGSQVLASFSVAGATTDLYFVGQGQQLVGGFRFNRARQEDRVQLFSCLAPTTPPESLTQAALSHFQVSSDGQRLLTCSLEEATVWQCSPPKRLLQCPTRLAALSPDGQWMASWSEGRLRLICVGDGRVVASQPHTQPPTSLRFFAKDGLEVIDGTCQLWRLETLQPENPSTDPGKLPAPRAGDE